MLQEGTEKEENEKKRGCFLDEDGKGISSKRRRRRRNRREQLERGGLEWKK